jgi:hypothetical protein
MCVFLLSTFFLRFSISWVTSSLILSIFILSSFISLFMVIFVSLWCLFRTSMISFICSCTFSYSLFLLSWISWVSPVPFAWPYPVSSLWNSYLLLAGFLISECSCGLHWVPWYSFSLFCWSLNLGICHLHIPLVPILIWSWGKMVSILFPSSHHSTWCRYCPCTVCNLLLATL